MSNITVDITENITQVTATINETTQAVTVEVTTSGAQPTNANLTALSGLTGAADKAPYFTGVGAMALATLTGYGRSIIALADRAGLLALLGLTTADIPQDSTHRMVSDTQTASWDAKQSALGFTPEDVANKQTDLTASATKYPTVNAVVAGDTATLAAAEIYSANPANVTQDASHRFATDAEKTAWNGKQSALGYTPANTASNLSDLVSASSARTNLGLGSLATQSGTFSGTSSGTNTGDETGARIATLAHAATAKTTLVDADEIAGTDSASSYSLIRTTMSNIWTYIKSKADAVYVTSGGALGTPSSGTLTNCTFPTLNQNTTGSAATLTTARTIDGVSFDGGSNITVIAPGTHAATSKATPVDADELALVDSAASNVLKKLTWANLKATLKAYFDTLYKPYITPSGTYATMVALSSPSVGQQFICTDCNNSTWTYNGAAWKPVGGRFMLWASTVASGVAPSGTINTGSSGTLTLGTAIDRTYAYGVFLELPAIATTPAIAAGKYYCVMSSTTVGTIYATSWSGNVPTIGAAINFSAGTTYTGITTRVECYTATALPGNVMGLGGSVVLEYSASIKNNSNTKVYGVTWGSAAGLGGNSNTNIAGYAGAVMMITNIGDTSHQVFTPNPMTPPASMGVPGGSAQDTTTSKTVSIGVTMAVATDYYIFQQLNVWVIVP